MDRGSPKTVIEAPPPTQKGDGRFFVLVVVQGRQKGERFVIDKPGHLGRDPRSVAVIHDPVAKHHHAQLRLDGDGGALNLLRLDSIDPDSLQHNGTPLLERASLAAGDLIRIGATEIKVESHGLVELEFDRNVMERLTRDDITGLVSRRRFDMDVEALVVLSEQLRKPIACAMLDIDDLKRVNDRHGHLAGAAVIARVGRTLGRTLGGLGQVARIGGDEFAVILPGHNLEQARAVLTTACGVVHEEHIPVDGGTVQPRLSFGVSANDAQAPGDVASVIQKLYREADAALLAAKSRRQ